MTDTEALKALVAACEKEFCSPATEGGELVSADDESVMGPGECAITFGKIRAARAALERMLASQTQEHTLWDHPQREVSPRPPVSPELDAQFKEIAQDMVLVPREPTTDMVYAACDVKAQEDECDTVTNLYKAMLAAAPVASQMGADQDYIYCAKCGENVSDPHECSAAPAAGMDADSSPPLAEPDVEAMAKEFAEAIDFTAGRPEARDVFRELFRQHLGRRPQEGRAVTSKDDPQ